MSKYINTGEIVHYSTPKRQNSAKSPEKTANTEVVYDNPSFDSILPEDTQVKNLQTLLKTQEAVKKWKHFQRRRRTINQRDSVVTPSHSNHINSEICGLDDESTDAELNAFDKTPKQANTQKRSLNKQLISYFVKLAKNNHEDDEVDFEFIEELLGKGADVNCCDKYGQSMLHEAAREWHTDIVLFLLDHGANIKCVDKFGRSLLHVAAAVDYPDMVELLVEKGCDIEAVTNKELQTPLHYAARNDAVASLKILLKLGAETEAKDYKQRTPLFVAAELDRSETAKFLVETNANATIIDQSGQLCMTHMITKMGPVANNALDQFHKKDRANRKQYYFLNLLETPRSKNGKSTIAKNPLEVIVTYRQLDLIMHPAIMRLIDVKWNLFGRTAAFRNLLLNFVFILIWTVLGVAVPWQTRYLYRFPQDWWRVVLLLCGCIMTIYYVFAEINEIIASKRRFRRWKSWREEQIKEDLNFCHPKWPEEKRYLEGEVKTLDEMLPAYFQDFWNYFDWTVYFLIFVLVITHIIDTSITPNAPCCTYTNNSAVLCDDPAVTLCATGFVNNLNLGVWNNRIFVFTIIFLWLRIMKYTRAFRFLGPFIVMLGKIVWDILRFFYLYLEFYIPYACAFWMIFGRIESISSMFTVDQLLFSLYRITLVDEYQYNEMRAFDVVMAYILIGTFLGVSAILCINLFIALLSDTFQRVYDNANANAVMQQAALILNIEENLSKKKKKRFLRHIEDNCSPECLYYDDDLTVLDGTDLKKVTIQIKDQMDELLEYVHKAETEQRLAVLERSQTVVPVSQIDRRGNKTPEIHQTWWKNDSTDFNSRQRRLSTVNTTPLSGALGLQVAGDGGFKSSLGFSSSNSEFGIMLRKMTEISFKLERIQMSQMAQEESYRRLRADVREVKRRLDVVHPEGVVVEDAWNRGGSRANSFTPTRLFNRPDVQLSPVAEQPQSPDSSSSDTPSSIFFRKTAGSRSGLTKTNNRTEDKASLLSRIVTSKLQDRESPRPSLPHVVDLVTLQGITESSDLTRRKPPGTIAGVRTVDLTVNVPSEELGTRGFPSDSHV